MQILTNLTGVLALSAFATAQYATLTIEDLNTEPAQPQSTACGDINQQWLYNNFQFFEAKLARECLTSVPFDAAVATRFIAWYNQTLQFHTTTAFLKNPPDTYKQPAADLFSSLQQIRDRIDSSYYRNQYVFDADVFKLIHGAHDTHLDLWAGAISQFSWGAPFQIVSVSTDGKEEPKVYFWYTIKNYTITGVVPSPIKSINDVPVIEFLEQYAAEQSFDMAEPHADWNHLMRTPAMQTMGYRSVFSSESTFYPGTDRLSVKYENDTIYDQPWLARYNSPGFTGPLQTGGDYYNFFILGLLPANYRESYEHYRANDTQQSARRAEPSTERTNWHDVVSAYPEDTLSHQEDLGVKTSGFVTSYYYEDISTAVICIPSFDVYSSDDTSFERAIADFISKATTRGARKIIIDLQQNFGGLTAFAFEAVRQFFPSVAPPSTPSRMRSHPLGDYLGQTMTGYFQSLSPTDEYYDLFVAEDWAVTDRISSDTKRNFTSWQEFYGPLDFNGDMFSRIQEYNLSSQVFDSEALGFNSTYHSAMKKNITGHDPWDASNVVILTDGLCSSACSLFVEIATQQVGVRTVVVGGSTKGGPMQAASGTRGARIYSSDDLDLDFAIAEAITEMPYQAYISDTGMAITYATFNLRDQIRPPNSNGIPNQFLNLPANCRIYWTLKNFNDYGRLWHDVSDAIYKDQSICIGGYQNTAPPKSLRRSSLPRKERKKRDVSQISKYINQGVSLLGEIVPDSSLSIHGGGYHDTLNFAPAPSITYCRGDADCNYKGMCRPVPRTCTFGCMRGRPCRTKTEEVHVCAPLLSAGSTCVGTFEVARDRNGKRSSEVYQVKNVQGDAPEYGYCLPNLASAGTPSCKA